MKKYSADYIFISPFASPPFIENGELIIDEISGKILSARKNRRKNCTGDKAADNFNTIIIPGFVNAHTHTDLTIKPCDKTPRIFSEWVLSILEKRKSRNAGEKNKLRVNAFKEFIKSGTTLIGDIIEPDSFYNPADISRETSLVPKVKGFIELRGLNPEYAGQRISEFKIFYEKNSDIFKKAEKYFSPGISPHSIYSVSKALFSEIIKENSKLGLKIAVHASEHASESDFIAGNGGDIAGNLLPAFNLAGFSVPPETFPTPVSYLNYLKILGKNTSIIHANEINDADMETIKQSGTDIIHCPRSNAFFGSKKLPLKTALERGIPVSLGTDSLYSNETLCILDELKYAKKIHAGVSSKDLFSMATVYGAKALSFPGVTGTLEPDSSADFTVFKIDKNLKLNEENIYDNILLFDISGIISVAINGNTVYNSAGLANMHI